MQRCRITVPWRASYSIMHNFRRPAPSRCGLWNCIHLCLCFWFCGGWAQPSILFALPVTLLPGGNPSVAASYRSVQHGNSLYSYVCSLVRWLCLSRHVSSMAAGRLFLALAHGSLAVVSSILFFVHQPFLFLVSCLGLPSFFRSRRAAPIFPH